MMTCAVKDAASCGGSFLLSSGIDFGDRELFAQFEEGAPVHIRFDEIEENGDDTGDLQERLQECEETIAHMRAENQELKRKLKLLSQPSNLAVEDLNVDGPLMQILFMNNSISKQYHHEIEEFINYLVYKYKEEKRDCLEATSFNVQPQTSSVLLEDHRQMVSEGIKKIKEAFNVVGSVLYFTNFCLDRLGQPLLNENPQLTEGWEVPKYQQTFGQIVALEGEEVVHAAKPKRPKPSCFNCGSTDHQLRDCPEPKNSIRINEKRKEFNDMVGESPSQNTNVRYHAEEIEERFGKFRPGVVSDDLQKALGVTKKDLPPYIYRMRQLGYPPGWLKEAELENSGLSLYHGNDASDGEIEGNDELNLRDRPFSYDLSKLVDYPGFNADIPGGICDDWRMFGSIPMQMQHQKEVFARFLASNFAVTSPPFSNKRASDPESNPSSKKKQKFTPSGVSVPATDMEVDSDSDAPYRTPDYGRFNFQPPLPPGSPMSTPPAPPQGTPPATPPNFIPPPPPTPTPPPLPKDTPPLTPSAGSPRFQNREFSKSRTGRDLGDEDALTLEELEEQQRLIWAALEQTDGINSDSDALADTPLTGNSVASSPARNDRDIIQERAGLEKLSAIRKEDTGSELSCKQPMTAVSHTPGSDNEASSGQNSLVNDGTSAEPSKKIPQSVPDISKFATGITPFEYENMSEATGVYLKLRTLLKNSPRSQMKRQSL